MKQKLLRILIIFGVINFVGILIFYGFVGSKQIQHSKRHTNPLETWRIGSESSSQGSVSNPWREATSGKDKHAVAPDKIRPVPEVSVSDDIEPLSGATMQKYLEYQPRPENESILILTPIHNSAKHLGHFMSLLQSITYPHSLISIAFGEDGSVDGTLHLADVMAAKMNQSFSNVQVFHFNLSWQVNGSWSIVHSRGNQLHRRRHLAQARNLLLKAGLKDQDWVLWIDSDITYFPPDIIQQLLSADKEIVTPLCVYKDGDRKRVFDKNTWRETDKSRRHLKFLPPDELVVEGYGTTTRLWLSDLRAEGRVVPIDGVGGCTLLVKSECHKKGVLFPEDLFQNHIETEGMAKLAKHLGFGVYGMPFVEVVH